MEGRDERRRDGLAGRDTGDGGRKKETGTAARGVRHMCCSQSQNAAAPTELIDLARPQSLHKYGSAITLTDAGL